MSHFCQARTTCTFADTHKHDRIHACNMHSNIHTHTRYSGTLTQAARDPGKPSGLEQE